MLIETDLIQKESDDIGPYAELVSWKNRSTKFNFLLEQIKSPICRNACGILKIAKSKILEVDIILDNLSNRIFNAILGLNYPKFVGVS